MAKPLPQIVQISLNIMSGTPVFKGTRVPVQTLLDHLEAGDSLNVFLADFPSVKRQQAIDFLELEIDDPRPDRPWRKFAGMFKDNPLLDEVVEEVEAYRRELDAEQGR